MTGQARGLASSLCNFNQTNSSDPLADLKASWKKYKILKAVGCQNLPSNGFQFESLLSAPSDGLTQQIESNQKVYVYSKIGNIWKKVGEAETLQVDAQNNCLKSYASLECVRVKFKRPAWQDTCNEMDSEGIEYGFSTVNQNIILNF